MYVKDNKWIVRDALYPEIAHRFSVNSAGLLSSLHLNTNEFAASFTRVGSFVMTHETLHRLRELASQESVDIDKMLDKDIEKFLLGLIAKGALDCWEIIPTEGPFSNLKFRVNSGFQLDLSQLPRSNHSTENKLSIYDLFVNGSDYFKTPLYPGLHVVFGPAGQGKSVFSQELSKRFDIPYFNVFESEEHSAITEGEIALTLRMALSNRVVIVDSLRFLGMQATGFPALDKGINSGVFTFAQWLSTIAMRHNCIFIAVISTERTDEYIQQLYKDMLSGAVKSAYLLRGYGSGLCINRDNARAEWQPFEFKNDANWSFFSGSNKFNKAIEDSEDAYRLHGADLTSLNFNL